ncbi:Crp/Fnr family transcriptional regulator [Elizabethkingia miricola]|uniref:Crp/Fnr family transcriptional regulator n=1 Tax=Elizabethkingia miricola TaxID=172045 RepID=UPI00099960D3|nr:Crp/Fnr family transcriptional regulator [Elizabethkingia miricola]OPB90954.1 Crp/Fnr family transcriptional regulator [Elizabethkingia miricola]
MNLLLQFIRSLTEFSDESWKILQPALTVKTYKKNELLLQEGQVCNSLFYIEKGYCRSFYDINGTDKNTEFFFENEIATNVESFGNGQVSAYNIIACEPLTVIIFDKAKLFQAAQECREIENLGRHCVRLIATKQENIEQKYPEMTQRISLSQLASFLGVARETLSRIRKRRISG